MLEQLRGKRVFCRLRAVETTVFNLLLTIAWLRRNAASGVVEVAHDYVRIRSLPGVELLHQTGKVVALLRQLLGLVFRLGGLLRQLTVQILLPKVSCDGICLFQKTLDRRRLDNPVAVFIPSGVGAGNLACILPTEACGVMHHVCQYVGKNVGVYCLRFKIRTSDARAGALARRHFGVLNQHLVERCVIIAHIIANSLHVNRLVRLP